MYLESDAFGIEYDTSRVSPEDILARIRGLGYRPRLTEDAKPQRTSRRKSHAALPEPVSSLAGEARVGSKPVFVDFYASWCGPCKVLERRVLATPEVEAALEGFRFVKVDTDRFPKAAEYFGVVALPTLVVLDEDGDEVFRHLGPIDVEELVRALRRCKDDDVPTEEHD